MKLVNGFHFRITFDYCDQLKRDNSVLIPRSREEETIAYMEKVSMQATGWKNQLRSNFLLRPVKVCINRGNRVKQPSIKTSIPILFF